MSPTLGRSRLQKSPPLYKQASFTKKTSKSHQPPRCSDFIVAAIYLLRKCTAILQKYMALSRNYMALFSLLVTHIRYRTLLNKNIESNLHMWMTFRLM